jgi:excisionase family DNA binding protein
MSSNLSISRVCQHCEKQFSARTTITKYCSHSCNQKALKVKQKNKKIEASNAETFLKINKFEEPVNDKDFLTVKMAALLLNMSPKTIYRLIEKNEINSFNFSERKTLIRRKDIDFYFDANLKVLEKNKLELLSNYNLDNSYTIQQIQDKFKISNGALYNIIVKFKIPKHKYGKYTLVKKEHIDNILR